MSATAIYEASDIRSAANDNRRRATKDEMEERAAFLIAYAAENKPVTVRQLFYAATVAGVPGIAKDDNGYNAVQRQVLELRRAGRMPYGHIADLTRSKREAETFNGIFDALEDTARIYRRALWRDKDCRVEIWVEKDALAGCILPVTDEYAVPLMVCRGFTSETFAYEAVEHWKQSAKTTYVYHLGDFDRAGQDATNDLERKLMGFAGSAGVRFRFRRLALYPPLIASLGLPTREPKRNTVADRRWPYSYACELDALPPKHLRYLVRNAISMHMPDEELRVLKVAEESERQMLQDWVSYARGDGILDNEETT